MRMRIRDCDQGRRCTVSLATPSRARIEIDLETQRALVQALPQPTAVLIPPTCFEKGANYAGSATRKSASIGRC
jgi:hypothetical protein